MTVLGKARRLTGQPWAVRTIGARHEEWSKIASADDLPAPSAELLRTAVTAVDAVLQTASEPAWVGQLPGTLQTYYRTWPGEHYRLLHALVRSTGARRCVEVGTDTALGAVAMADAGASVVTYDIVAHDTLPYSALRDLRDVSFAVEQRLGDLADPTYFAEQRETLAAADLIFVDGPKDGVFEDAFMNTAGAGLRALAGSGALVVVDDIRVLNMLTTWRSLSFDRMDLTSFGHWSGTGLLRL